jgi:hypothetical protein
MSDPAPVKKSSLGGIELLQLAMREELPIVAVLGQLSGWQGDRPDPVLAATSKRVGKAEGSWKSLLSREPLPDNF